MNLSEAVRAGISKLRRPMWVPGNWIELNIIDGHMCLWMTLYHPDDGDGITEQKLLVIGDGTEDYEEYVVEESHE